MAKKEIPSVKLPIEGKSTRVVRLTAMMQVTATDSSAVLNDGRENIKE
jgi:hypothetical protein